MTITTRVSEERLAAMIALQERAPEGATYIQPGMELSLLRELRERRALMREAVELLKIAVPPVQHHCSENCVHRRFDALRTKLAAMGE